MGSLSRMAKKCRECPKKDDCKHKRMEAEAYYEQSNIGMATSTSASQNLAMPLMRETMKINDGHGNMIEVYKDDIEKQIYAGLYNKLGLNYGA